jgi:hypothetical protein
VTGYPINISFVYKLIKHSTFLSLSNPLNFFENLWMWTLVWHLVTHLYFIQTLTADTQLHICEQFKHMVSKAPCFHYCNLTYGCCETTLPWAFKYALCVSWWALISDVTGVIWRKTQTFGMLDTTSYVTPHWFKQSDLTIFRRIRSVMLCLL